MSPRLLLTFRLIPPQPKITEWIKVRTAGRRTMAMDELLKTRAHRRQCIWCANRLIGRQRRYCSTDCRDSAWVNCYPQKPKSKAFIMVHEQSCACKSCGLSIEEEISQWMKARFELEGFLPTLYQLGAAMTHHFSVNFETDHIVPISKGGPGAGLDNVQVLCVPCHREKTNQDRKN